MRCSKTLEKNAPKYWILKGLIPEYKPLPIFEIACLFCATVKLASHFELIDGTLIAKDSTQHKAQNRQSANTVHTN
jgi:hypothetical protein